MLVPLNHDLSQALTLSSQFLDAQRSTSPGYPLPAKTSALYPWLSDQSGGVGAGQVGEIPGGFFMRGDDYVKYTFPQAGVVSMLGWGLIMFPGGFQQVGGQGRRRGRRLGGGEGNGGGGGGRQGNPLGKGDRESGRYNGKLFPYETLAMTLLHV